MGTVTTTSGRRKDGCEFPAEIVLSPLRIDGELLICAGVRDETERKRLHVQLQASEHMASLGVLAAGVGHEIRSPLQVTAACLDFASLVARKLRAKFGDDPDMTELDETLADARDGASRIQSIVQDLKVFSRLDVEPSLPTPVNLASLLGSCLRMARAEIRDRARIVPSIGDLPLVHGSAMRLGQVFLNLLRNAAHAIPEGSPSEHEIRVSARLVAPDHVMVEVADTGSGISPEIAPHVFKPFFTTKPAGVGTGLGLAICRQIVTEMGGTIDFESIVGKGTQFRVTLLVAVSP
jgi:signal transduction histidine kinase